MDKPKVKNTITDKEQIEIKQTSIFEAAPMAPPLTKASKKKPATALMKTVARKAPSEKNMKKVFTDEEIQEILAKRADGGVLDAAEKIALKEKYREIKRQVKNLEKGNQTRLIVFPALSGGGEWYKVIDFSALYYVYRLADKMGRSARIMKDSDNHSKGLYSASFQNIGRFIEDFEKLEQPSVEKTLNGIYIFTLKKPVTDDELAMLRQAEETRRERLHNVLKPKAMDPATYQAILMVSRQLIPKIRKLDRAYYWSTGQRMADNIEKLLVVYFNFAEGILDRKETGTKLLMIVNSLLAALALIAENRVWRYDTCAMVGENLNELKRIVNRDFKVGQK